MARRLQDSPAMGVMGERGGAGWLASLRGLVELVRSILQRAKEDRIGLVAGGMAFYAMLALGPTLVAAISLYGLFTTPDELKAQIVSLSTLLPPEAAELVVGQLREVYASSSTGLSLGALAGVVVAMYSATKGTDAIMGSLGIAFACPETRGYVRRKARSFILTLSLLSVAVAALAIITLVPVALAVIGLDAVGVWVVELLRWPALFLLAMGGLFLLYRYAPDRGDEQTRGLSVGALLATAVWLVGCFGFTHYVENFGDFGPTYGSLGGVIVLLLWLWMSAYVILLGAETNAALERQRGENQPLSASERVP